MDQSTVVPEVSAETKLSRRRLLKIIAATGGAVAASTLLPSKWARPVIDVGLLPAHAQTSIREAFWTGETERDCCEDHPGYVMQTELYLCFDEKSFPALDFEFSGGTAGDECLNDLGPCNGAKSLKAFADNKIPFEGCELFCDLWCVYFDKREKITVKLYQCPVDATQIEDCKLVSSMTLNKPD
jgi:hypothetical protein